MFLKIPVFLRRYYNKSEEGMKGRNARKINHKGTKGTKKIED